MADEELKEDVEKEDGLTEDSDSYEEKRSSKKRNEPKIKLKYSLLSNLITAIVVLAYFLLRQQVLVGEAKPLVVDNTVALDAVEVNLQGFEERLRVKVVLDAKDKRQREWLDAKRFLLTDLLIQMAQKKNAEELGSIVSQNKFKRELFDEFNYRLDPDRGHISTIYFAEFVISGASDGSD